MLMQSRARIGRLAVTVLALTILATAAPAMAVKAGSQVFQGLVRHVSANNIKVYNPDTKQTLGFALVPHFDKLFSSDGKTTRQMASLQAGQYVKVYYDQKLLGVKHADRILILNSNNMKMGTQKG